MFKFQYMHVLSISLQYLSMFTMYNHVILWAQQKKTRRRAAATIRAGCTFSNTFRFPSCVNRARVKMPKDKKYTALKS